VGIGGIICHPPWPGQPLRIGQSGLEIGISPAASDVHGAAELGTGRTETRHIQRRLGLPRRARHLRRGPEYIGHQFPRAQLQ
jgi:hypothetical protein